MTDVWTADTGGDGISSSPIIVDGKMISGIGILVALNTADGKQA
jgi:hypothetical protein